MRDYQKESLRFNIKESLKLIKEMKELGFVKIIGTPHTFQGLYNNTNKTIKIRVLISIILT